MTGVDGPPAPAPPRAVAALPVLAYVVVGGYFAWKFRYHVSSDAAVYLDMAGYFAELDFPAAFIGYWGPLLPALVAPLIALGVAPLVAGKGVAFVAGLAWVLVVQRFLATRVSRTRAAYGALVAAAPCAISVGAAYSVLPDTLLSMAITGVAAILVLDARRPSWRLAAVAGLLCGAAYYAKTPGWILCAPPAALCLLRNRMRHGAWAARTAGAWLAAGVAFAATVGPWAVGLSLRAGRFTIGSASAVALAMKHGKLGYETAGVRLWFPWAGERWVRHTGWAYETTGPVPFHFRYHVDKVLDNLPQFGMFFVLCPLAALGMWRLVVRSRRVLRSPRRAPVWLLAAWPVLLMSITVVEWRYLLYVSPLLVLAGLSGPTPRWLRWLPRRRFAVLVGCGLLAFGWVVRYVPSPPLGVARARGVAETVSHLEGGEKVWFNRLASGLPIAHLMDRDLAMSDPRLPDAPDPPDVVIWSEVPGARPPDVADRLPEFEPLTDWVEEDGLQVWILRRR